MDRKAIGDVGKYQYRHQSNDGDKTECVYGRGGSELVFEQGKGGFCENEKRFFSNCRFYLEKYRALPTE